MTMRLLRAGVAVALCMAGFGLPSAAQNISNSVSLGQTGDTNVIDIDQVGRRNIAGADEPELRLNQTGQFNRLVIMQTGANNAVANRFSDDPETPFLGLLQNGDRNEISIRQDSALNDPASGSSVFAILQESVTGTGGTANRLVIEQAGAGAGLGAAGHGIGTVRQTNDLRDGTANQAELTQRDGGDGRGNGMNSLLQGGAGNSYRALQTGDSNTIGTAVQRGTRNAAEIEQDGDFAPGIGENVVQFVQQYGDGNSVEMRQTGSQNFVEQIVQNNDGFGLVGNRASVLITGDNNGATGVGGLGQFRAAEAAAVSVAQGRIAQFAGDANDLRYTVTNGVENMFGFSQEGNGNGVVVTVASPNGAANALGNEVAVSQIGDGNDLTLGVIGNGNVTAATMRGERNRAAILRWGTDNLAAISIGTDRTLRSDDNNALGAFTFTDTLAVHALAAALQPGDLRQDGRFNEAFYTVDGSGNLFAAAQEGEGNHVSSSIAGDGNQQLTMQADGGNEAVLSQAGSGNSLSVRQY